MFRHKILSIGAALLASAAMLFTTGSSFAAGRGGGGGGRGGGGGGGYRGGYGGGYGGYRGYGYGGYRGYGYGGYGGWGYGGYGGWGYPYAGGVGYYYPDYAGYSYPPYSAGYSPAPTVYQSFYAAQPAAPAPNTVLIDVNVPAEATVWIDGNPTTQTGANREYVTPALTPGQNYSYQVKARWMDNGQPVEKTQKVTFQAGNQVQLNFR